MANSQRLLTLTMASRLTAAAARTAAKNAEKVDDVVEVTEQAAKIVPKVAKGSSEIGAKIWSKVGNLLREAGGNIKKKTSELVDTVKEISDSVKRGDKAFRENQMKNGNSYTTIADSSKKGVDNTSKAQQCHFETWKAIENGRSRYNPVYTMYKGGNLRI